MIYKLEPARQEKRPEYDSALHAAESGPTWTLDRDTPRLDRLAGVDIREPLMPSGKGLCRRASRIETKEALLDRVESWTGHETVRRGFSRGLVRGQYVTLTLVKSRFFPISFPPLERLDRYQARRVERVVSLGRGLIRHPPNAIVLPELDAAFARRCCVKAANGGEDDRAEVCVRVRRPKVGEEASARMPRWERGREDEASRRRARGRRTRRERRFFAA